MALAMLFVPVQMRAQYTSIVNQAANILQTAVMGGARYKGFVDVSYTEVSAICRQISPECRPHMDSR